MMIKRECLGPNTGQVPQGQHRIWPKLHCLNSRHLALTTTDAPHMSRFGLCASDGTMDCISILQSMGSLFLSASDKDVKVSKRGPKSDACTHYVNQGIPKPSERGQGIGVPVVVRPINSRIYRKGGQMKSYEKGGGTPDANSRSHNRNAWEYIETTSRLCI